MLTVAFHLTDKCNLKCSQCHWFSDEIKESQYIDYTQYLNWIKKNISSIKEIKLTGGEPTLYPDFIELVNNISKLIIVRVNSNGINYDILKKIKRPVNLTISVNRDVTIDFKNKLLDLGHHTRFVSYLDNINTNLGIDTLLKNEVLNAKDFENLDIIGKYCLCQNKGIRFGSDGYAYNCEIGLRTKAEKLRCGFSLWEGIPNLNPINCIINKQCFSNFVSENSYLI